MVVCCILKIWLDNGTYINQYIQMLILALVITASCQLFQWSLVFLDFADLEIWPDSRHVARDEKWQPGILNSFVK